MLMRLHTPTSQTTRRHALQTMVLLCGLPYAHAVQSQDLALSAAINRAGRLRALSQRLAKAHIQIGLGVLPERGREVATTAQALLQSNLKELRNGALKTGTRSTASLLDHVESEANRLLTVASAPFSKKSATEVSDQSNRLLDSADRLTDAYVESGRVASAKLINIAGRQRMLSQKLAKLYFLDKAVPSGDANQSEIAKLRTEFNTHLGTLNNAPLRSPAIQAHLDLGRSQWLFFENALSKPVDASRLRDVATTSERVLEVMNDLVNEYEIVLKEII